MDKVEVLATGLTDDARVALVRVEVLGDVLPELLEHEGAASEVERREVWVRDGLADDCFWHARNELNDTRGDTGFCQNFVDEIVGVGCRR